MYENFNNQLSTPPQESSESEELDVDSREIFKDYCGGDISDISYEDIPEEVLKRFEDYSRMGLTPDEYREKNFDKLYQVDFDGFTTYVAVQEGKDHGTTSNMSDEHLIESCAYLYEIDNDTGKKIGHGEIRLKSTPCSLEMPFVGFTNTENSIDGGADFRERGFGRKRLLMMNATSQMLGYGNLKSSESMQPAAESLWKKLVDEGKAELIESDSKKYQYTFKDKMT